MLGNRKDSIGLIVEGLFRKGQPSIDEQFESLREEYSDIQEKYNYTLEEYFGSLDEAKTVTFANSTYPKFGYAVVMAGGSGSGKGFVRSHKIAIDAKVIDVDRLKELYVAAVKKGSIKDTKKNYDFKNPDDVGQLHQIVKKKGYKDGMEDAFYNAQSAEDRKPNVIYDITGDDPSKLSDIGKKLKTLGYKTTLVWVVTNREEAFIRNLKRSRVVPQEIFHKTHNDVAKALEGFLKSANAKYYDEAWIAFGSGSSAKELTKEEQAELDKMGVIKLNKSGSSFSIPQDVEDRVHEILGPLEPDPANPQNYIHYSEFLQGADELDKNSANYKNVRAGTMRIRKDVK